MIYDSSLEGLISLDYNLSPFNVLYYDRSLFPPLI